LYGRYRERERGVTYRWSSREEIESMRAALHLERERERSVLRWRDMRGKKVFKKKKKQIMLLTGDEGEI
jgi:hypothetical protein